MLPDVVLTIEVSDKLVGKFRSVRESVLLILAEIGTEELFLLVLETFDVAASLEACFTLVNNELTGSLDASDEGETIVTSCVMIGLPRV